MESFDKVQAEGRRLFEAKNADYGDAFRAHGIAGVMVRIGDKTMRAIRVSLNTIQVETETLRDTLLDLHNYSAMALMLLDDQ